MKTINAFLSLVFLFSFVIGALAQEVEATSNPVRVNLKPVVVTPSTVHRYFALLIAELHRSTKKLPDLFPPLDAATNTLPRIIDRLINPGISSTRLVRCQVAVFQR